VDEQLDLELILSISFGRNLFANRKK
jgi:hypothetical protein